MSKIIVIGGGPSGMMAAISSKLNNKNANVILLEKNKELGRKLKLTGGGRCNLTANVSNDEVIKSVVKNGKFLYSSLNNFGPKEIIKFFENNGCKLKEEDHGRMFPITNKSIDIVNTLENKMKSIGVQIKYNSEVTNIDDKFVYTTNDKYNYDYIIVSTGGITLPQTGSNGYGHNIAKQFGHTITELHPQEVPLVSNDSFIQYKTLQGLSFTDVSLTVLNDKGKKIRTITHDLLITHFGLSGPSALRASFDVIKLLKKQEKVLVGIDFIPNIKQLKLEDLDSLPKRLLEYLTSISLNENELLEVVKNFKVNIYTTRGFKHAFVTNGGVSLTEVDPKTMKSKLNNKISFVGETLDVSAYTGGFNITSALSTGYTAGLYVQEEKK